MQSPPEKSNLANNVDARNRQAHYEKGKVRVNLTKSEWQNIKQTTTSPHPRMHMTHNEQARLLRTRKAGFYTNEPTKVAPATLGTTDFT